MNDQFPKDVGDVRPTSLGHLVGQRKVVEAVSVALDYSFQDNTAFPHTLMLGPSGIGKTQVAKVIAEERACGFHEVLASSITSPAELYATLMKAEDGDICFLDEIDTLKKIFQTALLIASDERKIFLPSSGGNAPLAIRLNNFTLIGATSEEYGILKPLAQRFALHLRFTFYGAEDLERIVEHRTRALGWYTEDDVFSAIAKRSKGVPRISLRLLQSSRRVCRSQGEHTITLDHLHRACSLEQIDSMGLDATEQQYLLVLREEPQRLNVLASVLGLPERTLSQSTESFLLRSGLITKDRYGLRLLTPKGREHLEHEERQRRSVQ